MSDPKRDLAELYQRVVQDELGLEATIDDDRDVSFRYPELGLFYFLLNAEDPECMRLTYAFLDATCGIAREELTTLCNTVNRGAKLAFLTVQDTDDGYYVSASVGMVLAAPDAIPAEALLKVVISRAVGAIKSAVTRLLDMPTIIEQAVEHGELSGPRRALGLRYQRAVQEELGIVAQVAEREDIDMIAFKYPGLGQLYISLSPETSPESMVLVCPNFFNTRRGIGRSDLMRLSNIVNLMGVHLGNGGLLASLSVSEDDDNNVSASVALVLAKPNSMPNEALLKAVIGRAVLAIKSAVDHFMSFLTQPTPTTGQHAGVRVSEANPRLSSNSVTPEQRMLQELIDIQRRQLILQLESEKAELEEKLDDMR